MRIRSSSTDLIKLLPIFLGILVFIMFVAIVVLFFIKRQDKNKELIVKKVKVLEKPIQQGNIEWYVVETENGERLKLRSFQANNLLITVGDVGTISFRGCTIEAFQRQGEQRNTVLKP